MSVKILSKENRVLLREMVKTDFKLRYQGSLLGHLWSVLKPLMLFTVMYLVFVKFLRFGADIPHFAVSLLLAIVMWQFFSETTAQGMQSIVARGDLLRKINFPKIIVVLSASVSSLINFAINLVVMLIFAAINGVDFQWHILLAPLVFIELYILALGCGLLLAALYVKFRDISHIWDVVLQAMFYATPIIYPLAMVSAFSVTAAKVLMLNPMAQIIQDMRHLVTYSGTETVWTYVGNIYIAIIPVVFSIGVFALGLWLFSRNAKHFAEEV